MKRHGLVLATFILFTSELAATSVRTLNVFEMVRLADRVFWGRCVSVEKKVPEENLFPIVEYTFEVLRAIKGVAGGENVVFRQVGPGVTGKPVIAGVPQYRRGDEVLLFLHADSDSGLTSPVGLDQGTFYLEKTREGRLGVMNPLGNQNLRYGLRLEQIRESGLSPLEVEQILGDKPIPLDVFTSMIEKIESYQARKGRSLQ